jgi:hypothetical protein
VVEGRSFRPYGRAFTALPGAYPGVASGTLGAPHTAAKATVEIRKPGTSTRASYVDIRDVLGKSI